MIKITLLVTIFGIELSSRKYVRREIIIGGVLIDGIMSINGIKSTTSIP